MRKCAVYILIFSILSCATGCDFLRRAAGRPVSADIEAKRELIRQDSLRRQAVADSLERIRLEREAYVADSLAVMDTLSSEGVFIRRASEIPSMKGADLQARFWLVTGAFRNRTYADRLVLKLENAGFESRSVVPSKGLVTVLAAPSETIRGVFDSYRLYRSSSLYNPQVWILDAAPAAVDEE